MRTSSSSPEIQVAPVPRIKRGWRLFIFYSSALLLTGLVSMLFADLLWRTGWSTSRTVLLVLFVILFLLMAIGCIHGVYGFVLRTFGDRRRITKSEKLSRSKNCGHQHGACLPDLQRKCHARL